MIGAGLSLTTCAAIPVLIERRVAYLTLGGAFLVLDGRRLFIDRG